MKLKAIKLLILSIMVSIIIYLLWITWPYSFILSIPLLVYVVLILFTLLGMAISVFISIITWTLSDRKFSEIYEETLQNIEDFFTS